MLKFPQLYNYFLERVLVEQELSISLSFVLERREENLVL